MSTPDIKTIPAGAHRRPRQLFKNRVTGEYSIAVKGANGRHRWLSLHTTDREDALRRLTTTGVGKCIEVAEDQRFTERVIEVLTTGPKITLEKVVDEWVTDASMRMQSTSLAHYRVIGAQFIRLFEPSTDIREITPLRVNSWINTAPSLTRRQRRMSILESLFQFAFDQGYRKDNPGKRLGLKYDDLTFDQMERVIKDEFTQEEFDQFLACPEIIGFWRHAIQLGWWLGLRISDICLLQWGSFCAVPGKLVVWQRKTRRRVELDLNDPLLGGGALSTVIAEMRLDVRDAVHCFPEMRDLYQTQQARTIDYFRQCCLTAGLDGVKTFHCLRKSAAKRWDRAGRSLKEIGALLGHESTGVTQFYLETSKPKHHGL